MTDRTAIVFGAGNVGRGFIGQLFSESGYEVVFVDIDEELIAALNARRSYVVRLVNNDGQEEVTVGPVWAYHTSEHEAIALAVSQATIGATAVGVRALPYIAPLIAEGVARRASSSSDGQLDPLNIIVCENMKRAGAALRGLVWQHLSEPDRELAQHQVGFVDTVIARMVPPPTPEMRAQNPSLIVVEPYKELPVDRSTFVGPVPSIVGMEPRDGFGLFTDRKLYLHNMAHAMLGYLGHLRGHGYGYQALDDPVIKSLLNSALQESKAGIVAEHAADVGWLDTHIADIVRRLGNRALGDTIYRLAHDPLRKLGPQDRLVGAAKSAQKASVVPEALSWGIAAATCFDHPEDPLALQLQQRIAAEGLDAVLSEVSEIHPDEPLAELVRDRRRQLLQGDWARSPHWLPSVHHRKTECT